MIKVSKFGGNFKKKFIFKNLSELLDEAIDETSKLFIFFAKLINCFLIFIRGTRRKEENINKHDSKRL